MKSSNKKLSQIRLEMDTNLDQNEMAEVRRLAASYIRLARPFEDAHRPAWLLCDWNSSTWKTQHGKRTRYVNGQWKGTLDVHWNLRLPNGSCLTDETNGLLLEACRQVACLYREGYAGHKPPALTTWRHFCYSLKAVSAWLYLQQARFSPTKSGFALLDQEALRELFVQIGKGGWTEANGLMSRCMEHLYVATFGVPYAFNLDLTIPLDGRLVAPICDWLRSKDAYPKKSRGRISRAFLAELIGVDKAILGGASDRFLAFLRQFEPDACHPSGLLINSASSREFPGHRTITIEIALTKAVSFGPAKLLAREVSVLLRLYRHLPDLLIVPGSINVGELTSVAKMHACDVKRTPFMPVGTGMRYLDEALLWVGDYGDALIDHFLLAMASVINVCAPYSDKMTARQTWAESVLKEIPVSEQLRDISSGFNQISSDLHSFDFQRRRERPTLHEAVEILIGAIVIVISTLKPSRSSEITNLDWDCLRFNGHFYLDFDLAKRVVGGMRAEVKGAPIPAIVAKAIKQLQRLSAGLIEQTDEQDAYYQGKLFVVPSRYFGERKVIHARLLDRYLDIFCDHVNLPTDEHGRRWYVRVHEMRKWTLLLLFWSGQEAVLDAASELAGHTNHEHIKAYIALEFPGETQASLEALYVSDRLRTRTGFDEGDAEFHELHRRVLRHFKVGYLDLIPERDFQSYIRSLVEQDEFHLMPFHIDAGDGRRQLCVALRKGARAI